MKKKTIGIILATAMAFSLAACGGKAQTETSVSNEIETVEEKNTVTEEKEDTESIKKEAADTTAPEEAKEDVLVLNAPVVIYEEGDVTITVNPIENKKFDIHFENNSASKVYFKYEFLNVNDYQIDDAGASSVEAQNTYDKTINLETFFAALGSDDVASVELKAKLYDYATMTEIADIGDIFIQGDAYGKEVANLVTDEAMLVYSDNQIRAYIDPNFTTTEVDFSLRGFTVNDSDASLWCSAENFSFNGTPYSGLGDFETAKGQRRFDKIIDQFYYSWVGVENADAILTIEFDYTIGEKTLHVTLAHEAGTLSVVSVE